MFSLAIFPQRFDDPFSNTTIHTTWLAPVPLPTYLPEPAIADNLHETEPVVSIFPPGVLALD
jgi:hypothetical protein